MEQIKSDKHLRPRAIITVDLFGHPADYTSICKIAADENIDLIVDAAQSFGASHKGEKVGNIGKFTCTSFFPAKPLGCYGDGGAIFCDNAEEAEVLRSLRVHGRGEGGKYDNVRVGTNTRIQTIQAAVLIEKLKIFPKEIEMRQKVANIYSSELDKLVEVPKVADGCRSIWAQYTIKSPKRDQLSDFLKRHQIPTQIYYAKPLHTQQPYSHYITAEDGLPNTLKLSETVLSLPMHPYLSEQVQDFMISKVKKFFS